MFGSIEMNVEPKTATRTILFQTGFNRDSKYLESTRLQTEIGELNARRQELEAKVEKAEVAEAARKEFVDATRTLIPGVTPKIGTDLYGSPVATPEASAAADRLIEALKTRCSDVRPVLAPVAGLPLCVDLKTFQIVLAEPYGSVAHNRAQGLLLEQKEAEKRKV